MGIRVKLDDGTVKDYDTLEEWNRDVTRRRKEQAKKEKTKKKTGGMWDFEPTPLYGGSSTRKSRRSKLVIGRKTVDFEEEVDDNMSTRGIKGVSMSSGLRSKLTKLKKKPKPKKKSKRKG